MLVLRNLFWLGLAVGIAWLFRRAVSPRSPGGAQGRGQHQIRDGGRMVRDRICNTYLAEGSALETRVGSERHFFCSTGCRDRFLAGKAGAAAT